MKIITPRVEFITEPDALKRIELAGRVCYKSEDKITEDSAERFVKVLMKSGHESVLEHSNIILRTNYERDSKRLIEVLNQYEEDGDIPHFIRRSRWQNTFTNIFSGNARAWRSLVKAFPYELAWRAFEVHPLFNDLDFSWRKAFNFIGWSNDIEIIPWAPGKMHNIITAKFICSRGVSHELVRHRLFSFSQESTRYVKYGDVEYIEPWWAGDDLWNDKESCDKYSVRMANFEAAALEAEARYAKYIANGDVAQLARGVLNHDTKTEVVATGTISQWERFFTLRNSNAAHPDIRRLAEDCEAFTIDMRKAV